MNAVINILVRDSFHTTTIARNIQGHLGDKVKCYTRSCPKDVKVHIFVLSGMWLIDNGPDVLRQLKSSEGTKNAKVVATSALEEILEEIRRKPQFGVDFTIPKSKLVNGLRAVDSRDKRDVAIILDEILASVND